jgi:hypothetical protein
LASRDRSDIGVAIAELGAATGFDAVGLLRSTYSSIIRNNVRGFTPLTGLAQIHLVPSTSNDLVVCATRSDTVLNQGTNNRVIGCQPTVATSATTTNSTDPANSKPLPVSQRGNPWLR